jgi:beta-lactamase class A
MEGLAQNMEEKKTGRGLKWYLCLGLVASAFIAGLYAGFIINSNRANDAANLADNTETRQSGYGFINPLLECNVAEGRINKLIYSFKDNLSALVAKETKSGLATDVAVYFRDLNNGPWYGIHEDDEFLPASLLKVPVMMAYYKMAESDPGILSKKIKFDRLRGGEDKIQFVAPTKEIQVGKEYTIEELIEAAIKYSDNQATLLLYENIPPTYIIDLYAVLGVKSDVLWGESGTLSAKSFAAFFRILFNASYLSRNYSEKALELLSEADYKNALAAGVPPGVAVAHKFGESGQVEGEKEFHDCGIIYEPQRPYLLCVMTKGGELANLESVIRDISDLIYKEVSR